MGNPVVVKHARPAPFASAHAESRIAIAAFSSWVPGNFLCAARCGAGNTFTIRAGSLQVSHPGQQVTPLVDPRRTQLFSATAKATWARRLRLGARRDPLPGGQRCHCARTLGETRALPLGAGCASTFHVVRRPQRQVEVRFPTDDQEDHRRVDATGIWNDDTSGCSGLQGPAERARRPGHDVVAATVGVIAPALLR